MTIAGPRTCERPTARTGEAPLSGRGRSRHDSRRPRKRSWDMRRNRALTLGWASASAPRYLFKGQISAKRAADISPDCRAAHLRETDCVAGHVGLELRNVVANYPIERSHRFAEIQPNLGHRDYSRAAALGDTQLVLDLSRRLARAVRHRGAPLNGVEGLAAIGLRKYRRSKRKGRKRWLKLTNI